MRYVRNRPIIEFVPKWRGQRIEALDALCYGWAVRQSPAVKAMQLARPGGAPAATSRRPTAAAPSFNRIVGKPVRMNKHEYSSVGQGRLVAAGSQGPARPRGKPAPTIAAWEPRPSGSRSCPFFERRIGSPSIS